MKRLAWAIVLIAAPAFGQTAIIGSEVGVGAISTAFEAPPSGDFGEERQSVAMLLPGQRFRLAERRVVSGVVAKRSGCGSKRLTPPLPAPGRHAGFSTGDSVVRKARCPLAAGFSDALSARGSTVAARRRSGLTAIGALIASWWPQG
jgi:hypothetical protein